MHAAIWVAAGGSRGEREGRERREEREEGGERREERERRGESDVFQVSAFFHATFTPLWPHAVVVVCRR